MDDLIERPWWVFNMPHGTVAIVPAQTPDDARVLLANMCYPKAPVHEWECVGSRFTSRAALTQRLLGRPMVPAQRQGQGEP